MQMPLGYNTSTYQLLALKYLILICRIYLTDYLCTDYELPSNCQFLHQEVNELLQQYKQAINVKNNKRTYFEILLLHVPKQWKEYIVMLYCLLMLKFTPECVVHLIQVDDGIDDDDDL